MKKTIFLLFTVVLFFGCTKEGPVGPVGASGNANVQTYNFENATFSNNVNYWSSTLIIPEITQSVIDNGFVAVYQKTNTTNWALPHIDGGLNYLFSVKLNQVVVTVSNVSGSNIIPNPSGLNFKVVVIPKN